MSFLKWALQFSLTTQFSKEEEKKKEEKKDEKKEDKGEENGTAAAAATTKEASLAVATPPGDTFQEVNSKRVQL